MTLTPDTHNTPAAMDAFWSSVDDGYFEDRAWMYRFVAAYIAYQCPPTLDFCDYGCGCGQFLAVMQGLFPAVHLYGVDYSAVAVRRLIRESNGSILGIECDLGNLSGLPRQYYDVAACLQTLEHVRGYKTALAGMMRTIKPGGSLILTVPNNDGWQGHHNHWTPETFRELLETYGEVADLFTFGRNDGDDTNILARVVKV